MMQTKTRFGILQTWTPTMYQLGAKVEKQCSIIARCCVRPIIEQKEIGNGKSFSGRYMNDVDKNFALNETLSKKIQESLPFIIESLQKTEFQYTGKALISFIPKSGYLINSILFSCKSGDPYSASILFRSLIEHSFRHLYIFVKALNDKNDDVGKTYYNSLKATEDLESVEKIINYKKIVYPEDTQWNTKGDHNNAIRETAKSFRIEKIFSGFSYCI